MSKVIGERIKQKRKELGLTQVQVREKTGISNGNLSQIENGLSLPSSGALVALSELLRVSIDWILTGKEYSNSDIQNSISIRADSPDYDLLNGFRQLDPDDQDEVLEIIQIKLRKKMRGGVGSSASGDPDRVKDAEDMGVVSA